MTLISRVSFPCFQGLKLRCECGSHGVVALRVGKKGCTRTVHPGPQRRSCLLPGMLLMLVIFLESTFIDQNNPKRQTAGPLWGSPKLGLFMLVMQWHSTQVRLGS